jgi:hypothetical protein
MFYLALAFLDRLLYFWEYQKINQLIHSWWNPQAILCN